MPLKINPATCNLDLVMNPSSVVSVISIAVDDNTAPGTNPVLPTAGGEVTMTGGAVSAHSIPIETHSRAANAFNIEVQVASAVIGVPVNSNNAGISSYDGTQFAVSANGFVQLIGGSMAIDSNTGDDLTAVFPDAGANFNWKGVTVANATHAKPVFFMENAISNALDLDVQVGAAITGAPGDVNDAGLSSYNDTQFTADADCYVSLVGGTDLPSLQTLTGDSGGVIGPDSSGNIDILGGPGVTVIGTTNTLTINSVLYTDHGVGATVIPDSGSFSTAAITLTTPVSMANGERLEFVATSGVLVIQLSGTQIAHLGGASTSAGGTLTGSATSDAMSLIYQSSTDDLWAISSVGVWILA